MPYQRKILSKYAISLGKEIYLRYFKLKTPKSTIMSIHSSTPFKYGSILSLFVLLLFTFSCKKQEELIQPTTEATTELTFRGDGLPIPGDPDGPLGCYAGKWKGTFKPDSTKKAIYRLDIDFTGTYLTGNDGTWQIRKTSGGPILDSGTVYLYAYVPSVNGASFNFALQPTYSYPFYGILNHYCNIVTGSTHEGGIFSITKQL